MFNKNKGTSLVLVNTEKGKKLFDYASNFMETKQLPISTAVQRNLPLNKPPLPYKKREEFFAFYEKHGLGKAIKKFCFPYERSIKARTVRLVKTVIGQKNIGRIKKLLGKR